MPKALDDPGLHCVKYHTSKSHVGAPGMASKKCSTKFMRVSTSNNGRQVPLVSTSCFEVLPVQLPQQPSLSPVHRGRSCCHTARNAGNKCLSSFARTPRTARGVRAGGVIGIPPCCLRTVFWIGGTQSDGGEDRGGG